MAEVIVKRKNLIFDATLMSSFMGCETYTDFRHNRNFVPITGVGKALELGLLFHCMIEHFNIARREGIRREDAAAIGQSAGAKYIAGDPTNEDKFPGIKNASDEEISHLLDTFDQYINYYRNDHHTIIDVERVISKMLYEDDEIRVLWKAKVDRTEDTVDGIISRDYKTSSRRGPTLSLNNQFMGHCLVLSSPYVIVDKVGLQKTLKPEEKFERVILNYSRDRLVEQVKNIAHWAYRYIEYIERGYPVSNYTHCDKFGGCIFRHICSSDRSMREDELRQHFMIGKPWDVGNEDD